MDLLNGGTTLAWQSLSPPQVGYSTSINQAIELTSSSIKRLLHLLLSIVWMAAVTASMPAETETLDLSYSDSGSGSWDDSNETSSAMDDSNDDSFDPASGLDESDDDSDVVMTVDSSDELTGPAFDHT